MTFTVSYFLSDSEEVSSNFSGVVVPSAEVAWTGVELSARIEWTDQSVPCHLAGRMVPVS